MFGRDRPAVAGGGDDIARIGVPFSMRIRKPGRLAEAGEYGDVGASAGDFQATLGRRQDGQRHVRSPMPAHRDGPRRRRPNRFARHRQRD
jgi:hypothetical protein